MDRTQTEWMAFAATVTALTGIFVWQEYKQRRQVHGPNAESPAMPEAECSRGAHGCLRRVNSSPELPRHRSHGDPDGLPILLSSGNTVAAPQTSAAAAEESAKETEGNALHVVRAARQTTWAAGLWRRRSSRGADRESGADTDQVASQLTVRSHGAADEAGADEPLMCMVPPATTPCDSDAGGATSSFMQTEDGTGEPASQQDAPASHACPSNAQDNNAAASKRGEDSPSHNLHTSMNLTFQGGSSSAALSEVPSTCGDSYRAVPHISEYEQRNAAEREAAAQVVKGTEQGKGAQAPGAARQDLISEEARDNLQRHSKRRSGGSGNTAAARDSWRKLSGWLHLKRK